MSKQDPAPFPSDRLTVSGRSCRRRRTDSWLQWASYSDENIPFEANANLTHINGAVGMARSVDPDSASSQFYICDGPQHGLDNGNQTQDDDPGYAVFGVVREGMDLVKAVAQVPTSNDPLNRPIYEVHVSSITLQGYVTNQIEDKEDKETVSISFGLSILSIGLLTIARRK